MVVGLGCGSQHEARRCISADIEGKRTVLDGNGVAASFAAQVDRQGLGERARSGQGDRDFTPCAGLLPEVQQGAVAVAVRSETDKPNAGKRECEAQANRPRPSRILPAPRQWET